MFAYCGNNPVNMVDLTGFAPKQFPILFEDNLEEEEPTYYGTFSFGIAVSGNMGSWGTGIAIFVTVDAQGQVAIQCSTSGTATTEISPDLFFPRSHLLLW
jgi:hypothetical protein